MRIASQLSAILPGSFWFIFLALSLLTPGLCQKTNSSQAPNPPIQANPTPPTDPVAQDVRDLRQIEADYLRAEMENNPALAEPILADDYVGVRGDGGTADKSEVLNGLTRNERGHEPYSIGAANMRERVFGDTACVIYTKVYTVPNRHAAYQENVLHIFTKRNGSWRLQVSSPLPSPRPQPATPK